MKGLRARELARIWPATWVGFTEHEPAITGHPYTDEDHVDSAWKPADLAHIVKYLRQAPALVGQTRPEPCRLCGEMLASATFRFDGEWLWPDPLSHLVERHDFVLPDRLVARIRAHEYRSPIDGFGPEAMLPWPP